MVPHIPVIPVSYTHLNTTESLDEARYHFEKVKELTIKLSMVENSAYRLANSIKKTQKRDVYKRQVYEETSGIKPGEIVTGTGAPVSVTLAPGILSNIFDGIEHPLSEIAKGSGYYISRGISVNSLDTDKKWDTHMVVKEGDRIMPGTIIAEVPETRAITHKVMAPPDAEGYVLTVVPDGRYTIEEPLPVSYTHLRGAVPAPE